MNTCPVYRRSGGYSYGSVVPGPIGSALSPAQDLQKYALLPFASSLCGSCTDVCPVKIDLHDQLLAWRGVVAEAGHLPRGKAFSMKVAGKVLASPALYRAAGKAAKLMNLMPRFMLYNSGNEWGKQRELPSPAKQSFREQYRRRQRRGSES